MRYAEARMMPGAADCVSYEEAANKGGAIMRAHGANREHLIAAADKEHRFTADVAEQHGSVRNGRNLNALREIWPARALYFPGSSDFASHLEKFRSAQVVVRITRRTTESAQG